MDTNAMLEMSTPTSPTTAANDPFVKKYYRKAAHR